MERPRRSPEHPKIPDRLYRTFTVARLNGYASGRKPRKRPDGFHELTFRREPFYYLDEWTVFSSGNFGGKEIVWDERNGTRARPVIVYAYGGGLTKRGLEVGREQVNSHLKSFLKEHVAMIRLGRRVTAELRDKFGVWQYKGNGKIEEWGWHDHEEILLNQQPVYSGFGEGTSTNLL